jgi:hypothetical protein
MTPEEAQIEIDKVFNLIESIATEYSALTKNSLTEQQTAIVKDIISMSLIRYDAELRKNKIINTK